MPQNDSNVKPENELSFEESMKRLEDLVLRMERADVPLEELLHAVEEARKLADSCQKMLDSLDGKVKLLAGEKADGQAQWREIDAAEEPENFLPDPE